MSDVRAYGGYILVAPSPQEEDRRSSGLVMPTPQSDNRPSRGVVLSVGEAVAPEYRPNPGDVVIYAPCGGRSLDDEHIAVEISHILAVEPA